MYFEESAVSESLLAYIPISSQIREISQYRVQMANVELQDYDSIMLDEATLIQLESLFTINRMQ